MKTHRVWVAAAQMTFRADWRENVVWIERAIAEAGRKGVEVMLFPECAITGYHCDFSKVSRPEVEEALVLIAQAGRKARCSVLVGTPTWRGPRRLNSLVAFNQRGREIFRYSKIHLTALDREYFVPGDGLAYFDAAGIPATAMICHERRYPELVRLPVMMGAQIVFHPNAGLDSLEVSKKKRGGRDGMAVRAFENEVFYVFANSVGPQGAGLWSAGDSKIVAPDGEVMALANNRDEGVIWAQVEPARAGRKYALAALEQPLFLRQEWKRLIAKCRRQVGRSARRPRSAVRLAR